MDKFLSEPEFQEQLSEQEKKYAGQTVICNFYQLGREGKTLSRELKKLIRSEIPVEIHHVVATNGQWNNNGKLYEIDEEKTEEWQEKLKAHKENLIKRDKAEKIGAKKLSQALSDIATDDDEKTDDEFGVNGNLKLIKLKDGYNPDDFLLTGTKDECVEYIKAEKAEQAK